MITKTMNAFPFCLCSENSTSAPSSPTLWMTNARRQTMLLVHFILSHDDGDCGYETLSTAAAAAAASSPSPRSSSELLVCYVLLFNHRSRRVLSEKQKLRYCNGC